MTNHTTHQPVLLRAVLGFLQPQLGESYLDLTAGYGGHAASLEQQISGGTIVLVDRDQAAAAELKQRFQKARIIERDFASASALLVQEGASFDMVLMDIGVSSPQLANAQRGFSLKQAGQLDMRMDQRQKLSADTVVNSYREADLANLLWQYGQERKSRQIAKAIVAKRPIKDTAELAGIIASQYRSYQRIHPATRSFQAIRIAVNDELQQLADTLPRLPKLLKPGGRLVIISFHSLEDRMVKQFLKQQDELELLNKKVVMGNRQDVTNRRARSAKLRAAYKLNKNKKEANHGH